MKIKKIDIQKELKDLGAYPIFEGSDHFLLFGEVIETGKIEDMCQLINHVFVAGADSKVKEIKRALKITDARI